MTVLDTLPVGASFGTWTPLVYGQPAYVPPPPPIDPGWSPLQMSITGENGDTISLSSPDAGIIVLPGIRGLGSVPVENHADPYATVAGSYFRDFRATEREIYWPLYVFADESSVAWMERNERLWDLLRPGRRVQWAVTRPDGTVRKIWCRYSSGGDEAYDKDPLMFGWASYGIYLTAHEPYWAGEPVEKSFDVITDTPTSFFGTANAGGPPFYLAAPLASSSATMTNPGKVDAWPTWIIRGELSSISLSVNGRTITVPFALEETDELVIDTAPTAQTAILNGVEDVTSLLSSFGFAPIAPGNEVPISITPAADPGTSATVKCRLTPLYDRCV